MQKPRILMFDIEAAGVQSLCADRGYTVCFGYKWHGGGKAKVLDIADYPAGKWPDTCQDDTKLIKAAWEIITEADLLVAHFGAPFDRKFIESRLRRARLPPLPQTRLVDTCLISREKFKLSSNRLGNLAEFLQVPVGKMDKRGGWPKWWMGALRGHIPSIKSMARYCAVDVECLDGCFKEMKPIIPEKYLINMNLFEPTEKTVCPSCGGSVMFWGWYFSQGQKYRRIRCRECFKLSRLKTAEKAKA